MRGSGPGDGLCTASKKDAARRWSVPSSTATASATRAPPLARRKTVSYLASELRSVSRIGDIAHQHEGGENTAEQKSPPLKPIGCGGSELDRNATIHMQHGDCHKRKHECWNTAARHLMQMNKLLATPRTLENTSRDTSSISTARRLMSLVHHASTNLRMEHNLEEEVSHAIEALMQAEKRDLAANINENEHAAVASQLPSDSIHISNPASRCRARMPTHMFDLGGSSRGPFPYCTFPISLAGISSPYHEGWLRL